MFGLKLKTFRMADPNTSYLVNGVRRKTSEVTLNPDVLGYQVWSSERGRSAQQLRQQAEQPVRHTAGPGPQSQSQTQTQTLTPTTPLVFWQIREYVRTHGCDAARSHYKRYSWQVGAGVPGPGPS